VSAINVVLLMLQAAAHVLVLCTVWGVANSIAAKRG